VILDILNTSTCQKKISDDFALMTLFNGSLREKPFYSISTKPRIIGRLNLAAKIYVGSIAQARKLTSSNYSGDN